MRRSGALAVLGLAVLLIPASLPAADIAEPALAWPSGPSVNPAQAPAERRVALGVWALGTALLFALLWSAAKRREEGLRAAMREAETAARAATARESARAEIEHFGKDLALSLQGLETLEAFGIKLLEQICRRLDAKAGVFHHQSSPGGAYQLTASYATGASPAFTAAYAPGEGLAGQAVRERRVLICAGQAQDWLWVESATLSSTPLSLVIAPILTGERVPGVVELALMRALDAHDQEEISGLLDEVLPVVALSLDVLVAKLRTLDEFARYRAMEELQGRILASVREGIIGQDSHGRVTFANAAALEMLGFEECELLGQSLHALTHHHYPDGRVYPPEECVIARCLRDGQIRTVEGEVFWRKDGSALAVEYRVGPVMRNGVASGAVTSFRDIGEDMETRRALARRERQLMESEAKLRTIFETSNEGIWVIDTEARTQDLNPAMTTILGRPREEILGRTVFEFLDDANRVILREQMQRREQGERSAYEIALLRPDATQVPCLMHASPLFDAEGVRIGSFAMVADLSRQAGH